LPTLDCRETEALLHHFVLGRLDSDTAGAVSNHVTQCAECRSELAVLRFLHESVSAAVSSLPPAPAGLLARLKATAHEEGASLPDESSFVLPLLSGSLELLAEVLRQLGVSNGVRSALGLLSSLVIGDAGYWGRRGILAGAVPCFGRTIN